MKKENKYFDAAIFAFFGAVIGVVVLAYVLFATGMISSDSKTIVENDHFWRNWIGSLSGWAAAIGALIAAVWTVRWIKKQYEAMQTQNQLIQMQLKERELQDLIATEYSYEDLITGFSHLKDLHRYFFSLKNENVRDVTINQFVSCYEISVLSLYKSRNLNVRRMYIEEDDEEKMEVSSQINQYVFAYYTVFGSDPRGSFTQMRELMEKDIDRLLDSWVNAYFSDFFKFIGGKEIFKCEPNFELLVEEIDWHENELRKRWIAIRQKIRSTDNSVTR